MTEIWLKLPNLNYEVSSCGNIRHILYKKNRILTKDKLGYLRVTLRTKKGQTTFKIHRLVAQLFLPRINGLNEVNHKDGNKQNNKVLNLEWSNRSLNIQHSFNVGLQISLKGEEIGNSKLKEKDIKNIKKLLEIGITQCYIAKKYKVHQATIWRIKHKKTWKHV